jgi:murein DD-endopeptidase MepM/ murein hydrolase activator NlpD
MEVRLLPPEPLCHPCGVPRCIRRCRITAAFTVVLVAVVCVPASAARAPDARARLQRLQFQLGQLEVPIAMGTAFWLAVQGHVKPVQARMQRDRAELRRGPSAATATAIRADLRTQQRRIAPLLPSWFWVKALLHTSYHRVEVTLLQVRRVVAATLGPEPGRNGAGAWRRVFHRTAPATDGGRLDVCPVDGPYFSVDTFGAPRPGGRFHEGVDLQTARGTPIVAALPGVARRVPNTLGGNAVVVDSAGGTYEYYAHLSAYGAVGPVAAGEVIGYAGATGDARGLIPHLHFELHPGGGDAVDAFRDLQDVC